MPKKILVVDDEQHIVRLMQVHLERAGYEVVTAFDGKDALEKVDAENPDLVMLDVMLPYMDGFRNRSCQHEWAKRERRRTEKSPEA